jgi:elongation factor G
MFGYIGDLRSMTKGRASFTMHFAHYEQVATQAAAKILARHRY